MRHVNQTRDVKDDCSRQPPSSTDHARTSPGPVNCKLRLGAQNEASPEVCERCGHNHTKSCPFFFVDGMTRDTARASIQEA
jgi:hypothetical protein